MELQWSILASLRVNMNVGPPLKDPYRPQWQYEYGTSMNYLSVLGRNMNVGHSVNDLCRPQRQHELMLDLHWRILAVLWVNMILDLQLMIIVTLKDNMNVGPSRNDHFCPTRKLYVELSVKDPCYPTRYIDVGFSLED